MEINLDLLHGGVLLPNISSLNDSNPLAAEVLLCQAVFFWHYSCGYHCSTTTDEATAAASSQL